MRACTNPCSDFAGAVNGLRGLVTPVRSARCGGGIVSSLLALNDYSCLNFQLGNLLGENIQLDIQIQQKHGENRTRL
jgi:hypothetical protein